MLRYAHVFTMYSPFAFRGCRSSAVYSTRARAANTTALCMYVCIYIPIYIYIYILPDLPTPRSSCRCQPEFLPTFWSHCHSGSGLMPRFFEGHDERVAVCCDCSRHNWNSFFCCTGDSDVRGSAGEGTQQRVLLSVIVTHVAYKSHCEKYVLCDRLSRVQLRVLRAALGSASHSRTI